MSVSYRREMNHNYMVIESSGRDEVGYECKMLSGSFIEGLLKFRVRNLEEKQEFCYEITSKQPLERILSQRTVTGDEIRSLLLGIAATLSKIEDYLLKEEQIMLLPEYIYVDPDRFFVYLCMVPGYSCDFPAALSSLLAYLMGKVNHRDRDGVALAYNLYHESLKENYGMSDLMRQLQDGRQKLRGIERPEEHDEEKRERRAPQTADNTEEYESIRQFEEIKEAESTEQPKGFVKAAVKALVLLVPAEAVLWLLTGQQGLRQYGLLLGGALFLAVLAVILLRGSGKEEQKKNKKVNLQSEGGKPAGEKAESRDAWRIIPEEKPPKDWTEWIESDNMRECRDKELPKEPETTLLAETKESFKTAVMESLSRERENIAISYLPFVIGKHGEMADYCLRQPTVSRLHLSIDQREGVYIVTDLNSTNGTIVEGYHLQANETVSLKNGDTIYMADVGYRFVCH